MTWSILARDSETGELGVAVATRFFAVGAVCPRVEGGIGALATQALVNPMLGILGMERLRAGEAPAALLEALLAGDAGRDHRQFHLMAADGTVVQHTGTACVDWCGHVAGPDVSVAGNMLAGPQVVLATRDAWLATAGQPMAERLLAALEAGEATGGDKRGKQSAALPVARRDPYPARAIRVDDHPDPLAELRRLHAVSRQRYAGFRRFLAGRDHPGVFDREVIEAALAGPTS
ncbi:MAG: pilus assembly protein [Belnapia sp.]|nr:pilus assembly protein [Belnapia sp.]